ncbi:MAG TPA: ABC transporter substrate-binding protein [Methylomirabilota bacterium]|jgi:NitT/TauT family transport system substrate-binding protein|nr:ABC transporter substrate-binding protein [Methylomirabilota bacterium]
MSDPISIQFTRFSAFYTPLIATIAGGFLKEEGLQPTHSVAAPGKSAIEGLVNGTVHVCQSAPSQGFGALEKGQSPPAVHFAQINEKDGFFLTARSPDPAFSWDKLRGRKVLVDHGGQPLAMFKYACHRRGLDYSAIVALDVPAAKMDQAFRNGEGDYIHQQGPAPQQLEHDGVGHIVASVGEAIGPCAFSSLAATREWLRTDTARRFMRAYRKARAWIVDAPAARIAEAEAPFFPEIDGSVLASTIAYYQKLGCWTPHVEITRPAFEVTLDVFQHAGLITRRHRYEDVVALPPESSP